MSSKRDCGYDAPSNSLSGFHQEQLIKRTTTILRGEEELPFEAPQAGPNLVFEIGVAAAQDFKAIWRSRPRRSARPSKSPV